MVEFVSAEHTPEEPGDELPTSQPRRAGRWYLALSAAVLLAGALIAGKVSGNGPGTSPSRPVPAPTASASGGPSVDPAQCPGPTACTATAGVPVPVAAAVLDAFPSARVGDASTVYLRTGGLWFREITARAGMLEVLVRIQRPDASTPTLQSGQAGGVAFIRKIERGFLVQVQVRGPTDQLPTITNLSGLADDGRLLVLG